MTKVSVEAECSPLLMVRVNRNWSKLCFRKPAGNVSTEEEVVTCWLKQEPAMELTGLHPQLKLRKENEKKTESSLDAHLSAAIMLLEC